jgi:hypothetical protein
MEKKLEQNNMMNTAKVESVVMNDMEKQREFGESVVGESGDDTCQATRVLACIDLQEATCE